VGTVIALTGAKVSSYGGRSLNSSDEAIEIDPDIEERDALKKWYDKS